MMRRAAVVDIGTNSVLYLLAEQAADGRVVGCWQKAESPRLGENLDVTGRIAEKPLERTIAVLKQFQGMAESHRPDRLIAVGT
ncbi:MAG TPA: hypothetical protein VGB38_08555, partial [bacterium]